MTNDYARIANLEAEDIAAGRVPVQGNVTVGNQTYLAAWDVAPLLTKASMNTLMVLCGSVNHHVPLLDALVAEKNLLDHRRVDDTPCTLPKRLGLKPYAAWLRANRPLAYAEIALGAFVRQRSQVMGQPWSEVTLGEWYEQVSQSRPFDVNLNNRDSLSLALDGLYLLMCARTPETKVIAAQCRAEAEAEGCAISFEKAQAYRAAGVHPVEAVRMETTDSPSLDQIATLTALRRGSARSDLVST